MSGRGEMRKRRREKRVTFTKGILAGQVTYKDMPLKHIHTHTRTHAHTHTHTHTHTQTTPIHTDRYAYTSTYA